MKSPNIIFENLRVEMARENIAVKDIAPVIHANRDTAGRKLAGKSPLQLADAFNIRDAFFPGMDVAYLFKEAVDNARRA